MCVVQYQKRQSSPHVTPDITLMIIFQANFKPNYSFPFDSDLLLPNTHKRGKIIVLRIRIFTPSEKKNVKTTEEELHGSEAFAEFHQLLISL
jgi:hypothetical protein